MLFILAYTFISIFQCAATGDSLGFGNLIESASGLRLLYGFDRKKRPADYCEITFKDRTRTPTWIIIDMKKNNEKGPGARVIHINPNHKYHNYMSHYILKLPYKLYNGSKLTLMANYGDEDIMVSRP